ncbi:MAG: hypothetical protein HY331_14405 [Chloroflexi bacterium]|nr:hypothetical protein [Chloroflexota bacterium]
MKPIRDPVQWAETTGHWDPEIKLLQALRLSRRELLRYGGALAAGAGFGSLLAGCAPAAAPPAATSAAPAPAAAKPTTAPAAAPGAPKKGGTLTWAHMTPMEASLNPLFHANVVAWEAIDCMFDNLVDMDIDYKIVPGLATDWEISPDGLTYTFRLRRDVRFHDGEPMNAAAWITSFEWAKDPANKSQAAGSYLGPLDRMEAPDEYTLKVVFKNVYNVFLLRLPRKFLMVTSPKALKQLGKDFGQRPVGTGPYKFVEWVPDDRLVMQRWDDYKWAPARYKNKGPAWLDKVIFKPIYEPGTALGALESGEINLLEDVPMESIDRVKGHKDLQLIQAIRNGTPVGWLPNVKKPPTDELAVRQAILHAVDREALVPIYFGLIRPAYAPVTSNMWGATPEIQSKLKGLYPYDPEKAKQLLESAGWKAGPDGIRVKSGQRLKLIDLYNQNMVLTLPRVHEGLQAQLKKVGIEVVLDTRETAELTRASSAGEVHLAYSARVNNDPDVAARIFACGNPLAFAQACDSDLDKMTAEGVALPVGSEKRRDLYAKLYQHAMERAYMIPLFELPKLFAAHKSIQGLSIDTNGTYMYKVMDVSIS